MILLEGPDGAGKTRLATKLTEEFPELRLEPKLVGSEFEGRDGLMSGVTRQFRTTFQGWDKRVLLDRHALVSEYLYSPVLNRPLAEGFSHPAARGLRNELLRHCLTVVCLPRYETVLDNVTRVAPQPSEIQWNILGLYQAYKGFIVCTPHPENTWIYDYEGRNHTENLFDAVREYLA